jgi:hypothetical protein
VAFPYADFLSRPVDFETTYPNLDFNDELLYPEGMATVTITVVPEPSTAMLTALAAIGTGAAARRRRPRAG